MDANELIQLNIEVAKALKLNGVIKFGQCFIREDGVKDRLFCPSESWIDAGYLITRFNIMFLKAPNEYIVAVAGEPFGAAGQGITHQIAACKAVIATLKRRASNGI